MADSRLDALARRTQSRGRTVSAGQFAIVFVAFVLWAPSTGGGRGNLAIVFALTNLVLFGLRALFVRWRLGGSSSVGRTP